MEMDGFSDTFTANFEADPAAEFLAREQDNLAGLEDDLEPVVTNGLSESKESFNAGENEIDSGFEMVNHTSFDGIANNSIGNNDHGFEMSDDVHGGASPIPSQSSIQIPREEPEKIKRWREEQKKRLEKKDEEEETKKDEMRDAAKKELEEWYKSHEELVAKNRNANREASKSAEKELVADTEPMEPGAEWERIAKLCDFNPKGSKHQKDISRMRSIILQVKQSPPAGPLKREH